MKLFAPSKDVLHIYIYIRCSSSEGIKIESIPFIHLFKMNAITTALSYIPGFSYAEGIFKDTIVNILKTGKYHHLPQLFSLLTSFRSGP